MIAFQRKKNIELPQPKSDVSPTKQPKERKKHRFETLAKCLECGGTKRVLYVQPPQALYATTV